MFTTESTERSLHRSLEEITRAIERLGQARDEIVYQLGHDWRRADSVKEGDVIYVGQQYGWQQVHELKLGADGDEMIVMIKFVVDYADNSTEIRNPCWPVDEFVAVQTPEPNDEPF